jgi:hypothetical protein
LSILLTGLAISQNRPKSCPEKIVLNQNAT